ncbi:MAG TPA: hypothetical protein VFU93_15520 [Acidimicrobiales bacterium]|nr:hypothetical protein [Acidimicrobiales bacterium]
MRRFLAPLVFTLAISLVFQGAAQAAKPTGEPARQCHGGGWRTAVRSDGSPFRNQGDCIRYANSGASFGSTAPWCTITRELDLATEPAWLDNVTVGCVGLHEGDVVYFSDSGTFPGWAVGTAAVDGTFQYSVAVGCWSPVLAYAISDYQGSPSVFDTGIVYPLATCPFN